MPNDPDERSERNTHSESRSELTEETRLPLKLVLSIVGGAVGLVMVYGALKMDVLALSNRIDVGDERSARIERTVCALAIKEGLHSSDCPP